MASPDHMPVRFPLSAPVRFTAPGSRRETIGHAPLDLVLPVARIGASEAPLAFVARSTGKSFRRRVHGNLLLRPQRGGGTEVGKGADERHLAYLATQPSGAAELLGLASYAYETVVIPAGSRIHEDGRPDAEASAYRGAARLRLVEGELHVPAGVPAFSFGSGPTGVFGAEIHDGPGLPDAFGFSVDRREAAARFSVACHFGRRERDVDPFRFIRVEIAEGLATAFPEARCNARQAARLCLHAAAQGISDLPGPFVALISRLAALRDAVVAGTEDPFAMPALLNELFEGRPRRDRVVSLDNAVRLGCAAIAASLPYERGGEAALDPDDAGALGALAG